MKETKIINNCLWLNKKWSILLGKDDELVKRDDSENVMKSGGPGFVLMIFIQHDCV